MAKRRGLKPMFSLAPVVFRQSAIEGRGVFAKKRFEPGDVIVAYAPAQRRIDASTPEAMRAADSKLTLLSEERFVIIPDTSVPGGWLCNHSCDPNADIYSDGPGRIQCIRPITPGQEVTVFYGWVTQNQPGRDPCRCGSPRCRGTINFDISDAEALAFDVEDATGEAFRQRLAEYEQYLRSIAQEQALETVVNNLVEMRARVRR